MEKKTADITIGAKLEGIEEVNAGFRRIGDSANEMGDKISESSKKAALNMKDLVVGFSGVATSAFSLYNAYDRIADMQVSISSANLRVKSTLNSLEDAQRKYNAVIEKHGANSEEAEAALKDLQIAQERHTVATERAQMVQENLNEAMVQSALTVIPSLITMAASVSKVFDTLKASSLALSIAEHARGAAHAFADTMALGITKIWGAIVGALAAIKASSIATTIAENARAVASAIANAVASWGVAVPIMIAAAAAAAVGIAAYTGAIKLPSLQYGGSVKETGPYLLHAGEFVVPRGGAITINIYGVGSPRETGDAVVDALRRSGVI